MTRVQVDRVAPESEVRSRDIRARRISVCLGISRPLGYPYNACLHAHLSPRTPPSPLSAMSKEKEQTKIEETSDHRTDESGPDAIDEKKLLRKLDWHLVPCLTILFLLSFLDRSNGGYLPLSFGLPPAHLLSVGNARIEGLATDLNMSVYSPCRSRY